MRRYNEKDTSTENENPLRQCFALPPLPKGEASVTFALMILQNGKQKSHEPKSVVFLFIYYITAGAAEAPAAEEQGRVTEPVQHIRPGTGC